ncbi:MAG: aminotransferase class I/II-fold pyridoxal phosphate-dependent enzyme [bacterium]|nr:aminotransferase class I/II-fold pyridoxal phosphate-dependent enzyme [bacterium]
MPAAESKGLSNGFVDLRSDTYNLPTHNMLDRLRSTVESPREGGPQAYTKDLEQAVAELTGKEAAVFLPTCSAANLLAVMALARPAENVVVDADSHIRWMEANSAAVTGGAQLVPVPRAGSIVDAAAVAEFAERASLFGLPPLGLICVENTHNNAGGLVVSRSDMQGISSLALEYGARIHVDGARIFNAAARLGVEVSDLCVLATTVSLSLNKSLGAPYGAALAGPQDVISKVRSLQGQLGIASIHQEGLLAAMALEALENNRGRPHLDNGGARELARLLTRYFESELAVPAPETNIILFDILVDLTAVRFCGQLAARGVLAKPRSARSIRLVVNRESRQHDLEQVIEAFAGVLGR